MLAGPEEGMAEESNALSIISTAPVKRTSTDQSWTPLISSAMVSLQTVAVFY
jgi:hypothetical protein